MPNPTQASKPSPPAPTIEDILKTNLAGRCFILLDQRGRTKRQGIVHCIIPSNQGDLVLVQYFEALLGSRNTMALIRISDMIEQPGLRGFILFEDDEHLRHYFDTIQSNRDKIIDREGTKGGA